MSNVVFDGTKQNEPWIVCESVRWKMIREKKNAAAFTFSANPGIFCEGLLEDLVQDTHVQTMYSANGVSFNKLHGTYSCQNVSVQANSKILLCCTASEFL